jgi:hypothetical protein
MATSAIHTLINETADRLVVSRAWAQRDVNECAARLPLVHRDDIVKVAGVAADDIAFECLSARSAYVSEFCDAVRRIGKEDD